MEHRPRAGTRFDQIADSDFAELAAEAEALARIKQLDGTELWPGDGYLLACAADVHRRWTARAASRPQRLERLSAEELVSATERVAEELGLILGFIPARHRAELAQQHAYNFGAVGATCEVLFIAYLLRTRVPLSEATAHVKRHALLIELWHALRTEELRRIEGNPLGVFVKMIARGGPEVPEALEMLNRRYLSGKIRRTFRNAVTRRRSVIQQNHQEVKDEVDAERAVALSAALKPFLTMPPRDFYVRIIGQAPDLQYLPASVQRDAQDLLGRSRADFRTLPSGTELTSLEDPVVTDDEDVRTLEDIVIPQDSGTAASEAPDAVAFRARRCEQAVELVRQHLGDREARIVAAFLDPGDPKNITEVASQLGVVGKTVSRAIRRVSEHRELRQALVDLLS